MLPMFVHRFAVTALMMTWTMPAAAEFRAGSATVDVTPQNLPVSMTGAFQDRQATALHDPLRARALVLAATHTHSAPTAVPLAQCRPNPQYVEFLTRQIAQAIEQANDLLQPAQIAWAVGEEPSELNNRRWFVKDQALQPDPFGRTTDRVRMNPPQGSDLLIRPAGPVDPQVNLLSVQSPQEKPIAVLVNYGLHYVGGVPADQLSADYLGEFARQIAQRLGDEEAIVGILSNGASRDVNNIRFLDPRPSFNAYMWADAHAIARIAELNGDPATAATYREKADGIKEQVQKHLWDFQRRFFFPMSNQRHEKDGYVVEKHTLTYETGQFAGSPHGREQHGYVPWAFSLPDAGFEDAWKFLMDPDYFDAPFGPTTVERRDPLFALKPGCCWWSGQSWPFATTQTLKAMANLLQRYDQQHIDRDDYLQMLHKFAVTHRKDAMPYIAEAVHPGTGSWDGHDFPNRSEHYFHSGFTDLVITGLIGVQPSDGDTLTIDPLAPDSWDYFALDDLPYRGYRLSVLWDKTGKRYGLGAGMHVLVNGEAAAGSPTLAKLTVDLPPAVEVPLPEEIRFNYAVNNDGDWFPRLSASHIGPGRPPLHSRSASRRKRRFQRHRRGLSESDRLLLGPLRRRAAARHRRPDHLSSDADEPLDQLRIAQRFGLAGGRLWPGARGHPSRAALV